MEWAPEAEPQRREEAEGASPCSRIVDTARRRGITSIVHFTRIRGLVGILASDAVVGRRDVEHRKRVRFVYGPNVDDRKLDEDWIDYVNLSVTAINLGLFAPSADRHSDEEWVILEFGSEILGDPGVVFSTTNNIYPAAHRSRGLHGFEQMFAPIVPGRYGKPGSRANRRPNQTTDPQAEVLYPFELPLDHLHTITVRDGETEDTVAGILAPFRYEPSIEANPEAFR